MSLLQEMYEQSMEVIEVYRKGKNWYLRGITEAQRRMYAIAPAWMNGMDEKSPVFTTDNDNIALGTIKQLGLIPGQGTEIGTKDFYSNKK